MHTSTNSLTIEEQAGNWVSSNVDLSDNMYNEKMESPRKRGIGSAHSINKNNYTPESSKKSLYDPKNTLYQPTKEFKMKFNPQSEIWMNKIVPFKIHKFYLDGIILNQLDNI